MTHRYAVGQLLLLRSAPRHSNRPSGPCRVLACLPVERGPVLYRVKSDGERNERIVEEVDLSPADAAALSLAEATSVFSIAVAPR